MAVQKCKVAAIQVRGYAATQLHKINEVSILATSKWKLYNLGVEPKGGINNTEAQIIIL